MSWFWTILAAYFAVAFAILAFVAIENVAYRKYCKKHYFDPSDSLIKFEAD